MCLEEYAASGFSRKQFCEQRGMSATAFDSGVVNSASSRAW